MILSTTRAELIHDLSRAYQEQNDIATLTDKQLIDAWKRHGIHAGTWDWDIVEIREM